jgi:hypothetical protein
MEIRGIRSVAELSRVTGINYGTLYDRMRQPAEMRLREADQIMTALKASNVDRANVLFEVGKGV